MSSNHMLVTVMTLRAYKGESLVETNKISLMNRSLELIRAHTMFNENISCILEYKRDWSSWLSNCLFRVVLCIAICRRYLQSRNH